MLNFLYIISRLEPPRPSYNPYSSSECSAQEQVLHCKRRNLGCSSVEGRSSTANSETKAAVLPGIWISAVASRCFPHPTLALAPEHCEQTLKDLKRSMGAKSDWDLPISDLVKNPDKLIFNPCNEIRWSPEGQINSPHLHAGAPGIFSDILKSVQLLNEEWGTQNNGELTHLSLAKLQHLQWKTCLGQNCNLGSCVCSERLAPWAEHYIYIYIYIYITYIFFFCGKQRVATVPI